jgi:hypothetical protein
VCLIKHDQSCREPAGQSDSGQTNEIRGRYSSDCKRTAMNSEFLTLLLHAIQEAISKLAIDRPSKQIYNPYREWKDITTLLNDATNGTYSAVLHQLVCYPYTKPALRS